MAKSLNWPGQHTTIILREGVEARYLGQCEITGRRRVQTFKDRDRYVRVPKTADEAKSLTYTTWLLNDAGQCRGDLAPCEQDWLGGLPS